MVLALLLSSSVFAQGMSEATRENYKNPKDEKGLCTSRNDDEWQSKRGYCKAIQEQLTLPGCAHDTIERIRQRYLKTQKSEAKDNEKMYLGDALENCSSKDGKTHMADIAKSPQDFAYVMMQYFSIIAIEESDWNDEANKGSAVEGLLGLKKAEMADKRYSCGCDTKNQPNIPPDRPLDGHQNMICGMYMALYWADKDGKVDNDGRSKPGQSNTGQPNENGRQSSNQQNQDDDKPQGFTRIFKSLEGYDEDKDKAAKIRDKRMKDKLLNFCHTYKPGSQTTSWKRALEDIDAGALEDNSRRGGSIGNTPATRD